MQNKIMNVKDLTKGIFALRMDKEIKAKVKTYKYKDVFKNVPKAKKNKIINKVIIYE